LAQLASIEIARGPAAAIIRLIRENLQFVMVGATVVCPAVHTTAIPPPYPPVPEMLR